MSKIKIVIALVAIATLTLVVVGLVSAQVAASQTIPGATPNTAAPNGGFFGWIGRCFGFRTAQPYYSANPNIAPQLPTNTSIPAPYTPYQGSNGYGYGPCWARW